MANGKIRFGKQAGGQLSLIIPDGVTNTEVTFPENGILATTAFVDSSIVKLMGNQTIEDVKTFTSSPIVPTPTTDFQVATKKYVDDTISVGAGTGGGGGLSIEDKAKLDSIEDEATKN